MKRKTLAYTLVAFILIAGVAAYIGLNHIAPYAIIMPHRTSLETTPDDYDLVSKKVTITTHDSLQLQGYAIQARTEAPKAVMILIHGIAGCKEHFIGLADQLADMGIKTMVFDGRAHGKSEGEFCTYGFYEKIDISKIVDIIMSENPELPIGVWGNSLGGAIAIQSLEYDERINFGIIESTFAELDQITYDYMMRMLKGIGTKAISDYALKQAGNIAQFNPNDVKPINAVANIEQPVLIAHGDSDRNISFLYGQSLYENLKSEDKTFVLVEGGGHFGLLETGGDAYKNQIINFIKKNVNENRKEISESTANN